MKLKILVTAGDGIGPEVTNEAIAVLRDVAALGGHTFDFDFKRIGGIAIVQDGTPLPADTLAAALDSDAVLLGAVGGNEFNSLPATSVLRLACWVCAPLWAASPICVPHSHSRNWPSTALCARRSSTARTFSSSANCSAAFTSASRASGTTTKGEAWNTMRYTRDEVVRVARIAFQLAGKRRKKLTSVDKANVLEVSQLWRATVIEVAAEFPDVTLEHQYVDAMAMHLMNRPRDFDVVLTENLFGDILSDESGGDHRFAGHAALGHHRRQSQFV